MAAIKAVTAVAVVAVAIAAAPVVGVVTKVVVVVVVAATVTVAVVVAEYENNFLLKTFFETLLIRFERNLLSKVDSEIFLSIF